MSRPEQKRLFHEYAKHFLMEEKEKKGLVCKLKKKMFGGEGGGVATVKPMTTTKASNRKDGKIETATSRSSIKLGVDEFAMQSEEQHIIPAERISLCKQIGSGEFGCVFQGFFKFHAFMYNFFGLCAYITHLQLHGEEKKPAMEMLSRLFCWFFCYSSQRCPMINNNDFEGGNKADSTRKAHIAAILFSPRSCNNDQNAS